MIIERFINGMERKAARRGWCNGRPPHGYEIDHNSGYLDDARSCHAGQG